jgi:hypothetical protein
MTSREAILKELEQTPDDLLSEVANYVRFLKSREAGTTRNLLIGTLLSDRLELQAPIPLVLEHDGDQFIAASPDLNVHGVGEDESAALDDLRQAIEDFYFSLKGDELGHELGRRFAYLKSIMVEK